MNDQFKEELRNDPRYQYALANIPEDQRELFEQIVLRFVSQFNADVLQRFAEHVRMATTGDK